MSNYITTDFLNLRSRPLTGEQNVLAVMPPDTVVEDLNANSAPGWLNVKTVLGNTETQGFVSEKYLASTTLPLPVLTPPANLPPVHYPTGGRTVNRMNINLRAYPLNEPGLVQFDLKSVADPVERKSDIHKVIGYLDVEHSARYAPDSKHTYCNIYAYDVAYCLGAYLPRVWWTESALAELKEGKEVTPLYDRTITELTANLITDWFEKYGPSFGWRRFFDLTLLQNEVNKGMSGIIVAQRINMNNSGHIDAVVPETSTLSARRSGNQVLSPLQSQAGAKNKQYYTGLNWWEDTTRFKKFGFWVNGAE